MKSKLLYLFCALLFIDSCFSQDKDYFWIHKSNLKDYRYKVSPIGTKIEGFNERAKAEIQNKRKNTLKENDTNIAKVCVFWCTSAKCNEKEYKNFYISKWNHPQQDKGQDLFTVSKAYGTNAFSRDIEEEFRGFRGIPPSSSSKGKLPSFAQPYCHSEQAFLSHLHKKSEEMVASMNDIPEVVIINIVSTNPACATCLKTLNKFRIDKAYSEKLIKILFPVVKEENVRLHFLYHFTEQSLTTLEETHLEKLETNYFLETGKRPGD